MDPESSLPVGSETREGGDQEGRLTEKGAREQHLPKLRGGPGSFPNPLAFCSAGICQPLEELPWGCVFYSQVAFLAFDQLKVNYLLACGPRTVWYSHHLLLNCFHHILRNPSSPFLLPIIVGGH